MHRKMSRPTYLGACTYARIGKLTCLAYSSLLHEQILLKFQPYGFKTQIHRNIIQRI